MSHDVHLSYTDEKAAELQRMCATMQMEEREFFSFALGLARAIIQATQDGQVLMFGDPTTFSAVEASIPQLTALRERAQAERQAIDITSLLAPHASKPD